MSGEKILVADDAREMRESIADHILRPAGYDVLLAEDGAVAFRLAREYRPDLIVADWNMPGLDGLELKRVLATHGFLPPFILISVESSDEILSKSAVAGVAAFLHKPLNADVLLAVVRNHLEKKHSPSPSNIVRKARDFESVLEYTCDGIMVVDDSNRVVMINSAARAAFNLDPDAINGHSLLEIVHNQELRDLLIRTSSTTPEQYAEITLDNDHVLHAHVSPVPNVGRAVIMQDITRLKKIDRAKSEFVVAVSHDLRTPLTAILGYVELIKRVGPVNEQQDKFISNVEHSVKSISTLVTDLLDLSRIEAGFDTQKEATGFVQLIRYALDSLSPKANLKKQKLAINLPDFAPPVFGSPVRLRQMAVNLLDNAIKYTPQGGTITVTMLEAEDQEIFTVTDTGIGISLEDQPLIFDKFYRAKDVPDTIHGTGLGLSIVKSIVESHGGRIWVDSKPNQGTTFTVVLPKHERRKSKR